MFRTIALEPSPELDQLPELTASGRSALVVRPDTAAFRGWDDVFGADVPPYDDYLLEPGDYAPGGHVS